MADEQDFRPLRPACVRAFRDFESRAEQLENVSVYLSSRVQSRNGSLPEQYAGESRRLILEFCSVADRTLWTFRLPSMDSGRRVRSLHYAGESRDAPGVMVRCQFRGRGSMETAAGAGEALNREMALTLNSMNPGMLFSDCVRDLEEAGFSGCRELRLLRGEEPASGDGALEKMLPLLRGAGPDASGAAMGLDALARCLEQADRTLKERNRRQAETGTPFDFGAFLDEDGRRGLACLSVWQLVCSQPSAGAPGLPYSTGGAYGRLLLCRPEADRWRSRDEETAGLREALQLPAVCVRKLGAKPDGEGSWNGSADTVTRYRLFREAATGIPSDGPSGMPRAVLSYRGVLPRGRGAKLDPDLLQVSFGEQSEPLHVFLEQGRREGTAEKTVLDGFPMVKSLLPDEARAAAAAELRRVCRKPGPEGDWTGRPMDLAELELYLFKKEQGRQTKLLDTMGAADKKSILIRTRGEDPEFGPVSAMALPDLMALRSAARTGAAVWMEDRAAGVPSRLTGVMSYGDLILKDCGLRAGPPEPEPRRGSDAGKLAAKLRRQDAVRTAAAAEGPGPETAAYRETLNRLLEHGRLPQDSRRLQQLNDFMVLCDCYACAGDVSVGDVADQVKKTYGPGPGPEKLLYCPKDYAESRIVRMLAASSERMPDPLSVFSMAPEEQNRKDGIVRLTARVSRLCPERTGEAERMLRQLSLEADRPDDRRRGAMADQVSQLPGGSRYRQRTGPRAALRREVARMDARETAEREAGMEHV